MSKSAQAIVGQMKSTTGEIRLEELPTPIGTIQLVTTASGAISYIDWEKRRDRLHRFMLHRYGMVVVPRGASGEPTRARSRLAAYFDGDLKALDCVPVDAAGTTFQTAVWSELRRIPAGETISYRDLAVRIGKPSATRAVALANGANPIPIVVPCHRVIGSRGTLTGFGGGLERKLWLLTHERALLA
jgi:methylated-DNA-[protein]-cysteine S-methyltransferase